MSIELIIGVILGVIVFLFAAYAIVVAGDCDEEYEEAMKDISEYKNTFDDYI
jgi:uncharacterized membrane-anchored protein YhcB (DUF1043 family)